jgi:hypothetical protein
MRSFWQLALVVAAFSLACGRSDLDGPATATVDAGASGAGAGAGGVGGNGGEPGICQAGCLCFPTEACPPGCYSPPGGGCYNGGPPASTVDAAVGEPGPSIDAAIDALDAPDLADARVDGGRVPYRAIAVAAGAVHVCVILDDHKVKCWGRNSYGQLGLGDSIDRGGSAADMGDNLPTVDLGTGRTAVAISAGHYATCAILDDGTTKCWGMVGFDIAPVPLVGVAPDQMGDHLAPLDFGGRKATHLGLGWWEGSASMDDNTIWTWTAAPQMSGAGPPASRVMDLCQDQSGHIFALYADGSVSAIDGIPEDSALVPEGRRAVAIAGAYSGLTCAVLDDATMMCLQTAYDVYDFGAPSDTVGLGVQSMNRDIATLSSDGRVHDLGCQYPAVGTPYWCLDTGSATADVVNLGQAATAITDSGEGFTCVLLVDGNVRCWDADVTRVPPTTEWLGASLDFTTQSDGGVTIGAWHSVDLGTHP